MILPLLHRNHLQQCSGPQSPREIASQHQWKEHCVEVPGCAGWRLGRIHQPALQLLHVATSLSLSSIFSKRRALDVTLSKKAL